MAKMRVHEVAKQLNKTSKEIGNRVSFISMLAYYPGLHTVDEDMAVDIINEDRFSR